MSGTGHSPFSPQSFYSDRTSKTPITSTRRPDNFNFWQSKDIQNQPNRRDDIHKRISAHYQSIRDGNAHYTPSPGSDLWICKPVPMAHRHQIHQTKKIFTTSLKET